MKHKLRRLPVILLALLLILTAGVGLYAADYYHMDSTAAAALAGAEQSHHMTIFSADEAHAGLIFYPGGKVEATAYAPLMEALAAQGITCVIAHMPLNLAVLDTNAASDIPERFPHIDSWYIAGHSLGGSMAASYAAEAKDISGLILLAAYSTADLTDSSLPVLSIYGSEDGVLNMEKYTQYRSYLPTDTTELILPGGNHAQFGSYGQQEGDGEATLSPADQLQQTADAIADFIQ